MVPTTATLSIQPGLDAREILMTAREVSAILARLHPDSPTALILRQARSELRSLIPATDAVPTRSESLLTAA